MKTRVLLVVLCLVEVIILVAQPGTGWVRHDWGAEIALADARRDPTPAHLAKAAAARERIAARRRSDERVWAALLLGNAAAIALVGMRLARNRS